MKIAVLTSGGVDSSVALRLLKNEGHDVTAFYLKIWLEDEFQHLGDCPWEEDLTFIRLICDQEQIPLNVISMQKEYWDRVVAYTIDECKAGRTPNPDVLCNQQIKFGQFYEKIEPSFEKVATGHYAQVMERGGLFHLMRSSDPIKDQTYFLSQLSQSQLSRALFPIGFLAKQEVRSLAKKFKLPNQDRKDSQGICFLGKIPYREFIRQHLGIRKGDFIDPASGKTIGEHEGYWFYTIGQRFGLKLSGGPWFVVAKDISRNIVYLVNGKQPTGVLSDRFTVGSSNWIVPVETQNVASLRVKIRHGAAMHDCTIQLDGKHIHVQLSEPIHGIAPGQFAVFYDGDECLGGGVIQLPKG